VCFFLKKNQQEGESSTLIPFSCLSVPLRSDQRGHGRMQEKKLGGGGGKVMLSGAKFVTKWGANHYSTRLITKR
jgi:hypothetical protein